MVSRYFKICMHYNWLKPIWRCLPAGFGWRLWGPWEPGLMRQMILCPAPLCYSRTLHSCQSRRRGVRQQRLTVVCPTRLCKAEQEQSCRGGSWATLHLACSTKCGRAERGEAVVGRRLPEIPGLSRPHCCSCTQPPTNLHHCTTFVPLMFTMPGICLLHASGIW